MKSFHFWAVLISMLVAVPVTMLSFIVASPTEINWLAMFTQSPLLLMFVRAWFFVALASVLSCIIAHTLTVKINNAT